MTEREPDPSASAAGRRSLAASALLRGRALLARSFRLHRPRGAFCHDGWCQQCKVRVHDGSVVLACQQGDEGVAMRPRGGLMRLVGALVERQPPWFYETRFLRPRAWRQGYLDLLRRLSGALPLPDVAPPPGAAWREVACDVLVVGGGVAGLSAARAVAAAGRSVVLVDHGRRRPVRWQAERDAQRAAAVNAGCAVHERTLCVGLYEAPRRALCVDDAGSLVVRHAQLVVATGAYDRLLPFGNNDLPGIIGVRALEVLQAQAAIPEGARIGLYGEHDEVRRALDALQAASRRAHWLAGPSSLPAAPDGTPVHPQVGIVDAQGGRRIRSVRLSSGVRLACDLLVLGFSQPGYELQMQRQARLALHGCPARLVPDVSGSGVLVVGEAAGDTDGATAAHDASGRATQWLNTGACAPPPACAQHAALGELRDDAFLCPCEDVRVRDVRQAIADGYDDIELIKRHTGAATGPCQGKLCHANLLQCVSRDGVEARLPTQRPLVRPVTFAQFAGAPEEER
jgi:sarcosine oxidase subunit alpha